MQIIDYVILGIAVIGLIVAVAVGTSYLFKFPMQWLSGVIPDEKILSIVCIVITAIVLAIIYGVIAHFVKKPFKHFKLLKAVDKILGAALSVAVVYALVAIFVEALTRTDIEFMAKLQELLAPQTENSWIINNVYANNFFGKWIFDVISNGIAQIAPAGVAVRSVTHA